MKSNISSQGHQNLKCLPRGRTVSETVQKRQCEISVRCPNCCQIKISSWSQESNNNSKTFTKVRKFSLLRVTFISKLDVTVKPMNNTKYDDPLSMLTTLWYMFPNMWLTWRYSDNTMILRTRTLYQSTLHLDEKLPTVFVDYTVAFDTRYYVPCPANLYTIHWRKWLLPISKVRSMLRASNLQVCLDFYDS